MNKRAKDNSGDRTLKQDASFKVSNLKRESSLDDPYSQRYVDLEDKRMAAVRAAAHRTYETLRYSGTSFLEDHADMELEGPGNRIVSRFASDYFLTIYMLVVTRCFNIYNQRLKQDNSEGRRERARYRMLKTALDIDAYAVESIEQSAKHFHGQWLSYIGPDQANQAAGVVINLTDDYVVNAALSDLRDKGALHAPDDVWDNAFEQSITEQDHGAFDVFYVTFTESQADELVKQLDATAMPLEELRAWAGITWLEDQAKGGDYRGLPSIWSPGTGLAQRTAVSPTVKPAQTMDRTGRALASWNYTIGDAPVFIDPNNGFRVTYCAEGLNLEAARKDVEAMSPRTADVWKLITAEILEHWHKHESEPPCVWIDAHKLCDEMGYEKQKRGGHKTKNIAVVVRALRDLERCYIEIARGSTIYPKNSPTGERASKILKVRRISKTLQVIEVGEAKVRVDGEFLPVHWKITAGDWIKDYPRNQFAPLFKPLIRLPGKYRFNLWAKALGTELIYQYRQNRGETKVEFVKTMLRQAGSLEKVLKDKNKERVRDDFENAMDLLKKHLVCKSWVYNSEDHDNVFPGAKGWFEVWLKARVEMTPTDEIAKIMKMIAKESEKHQKNR